MAKAETKDKETTPPAPPAGGNPPQQQQQAERARIEVDSSTTIPTHANFCRVSGTPEEVVIDFGLNPQPNTQNPDPIAVSQRVVVSYYTAKRLLQVLHMTVQQHEGAFGVLETDFRKRMTQQQQSAGRTS